MAQGFTQRAYFFTESSCIAFNLSNSRHEVGLDF